MASARILGREQGVCFGTSKEAPWLVRNEEQRGQEGVTSRSRQRPDREMHTRQGPRQSWNGQGWGSQRRGRMDGF